MRSSLGQAAACHCAICALLHCIDAPLAQARQVDDRNADPISTSPHEIALVRSVAASNAALMRRAAALCFAVMPTILHEHTSLSMCKITEVLRLYFERSRSKREIARIIVYSPSTVTDYLSRGKLAGPSYSLPFDVNQAASESRLFPPSKPSAVHCPAPDWVAVQAGLRRKDAILDLLRQEYKAEQTDGFQYSAFCECYRCWHQHLSLSMRQTHTPGERHAEAIVEITEKHSGEIWRAQIFVPV